MNPTKAAEKGWEDSYKLAKLIKLQDEEIDQGEVFTEQFGGIEPDELNEAFTLRSNSARHHSPLNRTMSTHKGRNGQVFLSTDRFNLMRSADRSDHISLRQTMLKESQPSESRPRILSDENPAIN